MLTARTINRNYPLFTARSLPVNAMDLRDLEYFAVAARHTSLAKASEALELSPAALSKSLQRLEAATEAKLMERGPGGVVLTGAGRLLLAKVDRMRIALDDIKREAADIASGRTGRLRVGVSQIDWEQIALACARLLEKTPDLAFDLQVSTNDVMIPRLLKGELDMIFNLLLERPADGTEQELLFRDELFVCASADHPLARRGRLRISDIARERWMVSPSDVLSRQCLERAFNEAGVPAPVVSIESRSVQVRLITLANSRLLGIASTRLIRYAASIGMKLAALPIKDLSWPISIGVISRKGGYLTRSAQRLIEALRSATTR